MFLFDTGSRIERIELDPGSTTANIYHKTNHDPGTHDSLLMGAVFDVIKGTNIEAFFDMGSAGLGHTPIHPHRHPDGFSVHIAYFIGRILRVKLTLFKFGSR